MREYYIKHKKQILTSIPLFIILIAVFAFSSQNDADSRSLSAIIVDKIVGIVFPEYNCISPGKQSGYYNITMRYVRKIAHFSEFSSLGFFVLLHVRTWDKLKHPAFCVWLFGTLCGIADEIHQIFSSGRSPKISDAVLDSCGVLFGIFMFLLIADIIKGDKRNERC